MKTVASHDPLCRPFVTEVTSCTYGTHLSHIANMVLLKTDLLVNNTNNFSAFMFETILHWLIVSLAKA